MSPFDLWLCGAYAILRWAYPALARDLPPDVIDLAAERRRRAARTLARRL